MKSFLTSFSIDCPKNLFITGNCLNPDCGDRPKCGNWQEQYFRPGFKDRAKADFRLDSDSSYALV